MSTAHKPLNFFSFSPQKRGEITSIVLLDIKTPRITTMIQIRVERQKGYFGMIRALEIIVDGTNLGKINQGQTLIFDAPDGAREIWGKMDWGKTCRLDIANYDLNQTVVFKGLFTLNFFRNLGLVEIPFAVHLRAANDEERRVCQRGRDDVDICEV